MISILLPLGAVISGFLALYIFRTHQIGAMVAILAIPPVLLSLYVVGTVGADGWMLPGLAIATVIWAIFAGLGGLLAKVAALRWEGVR